MSFKNYFIADVHLETEDVRKRDLFLTFLEMVKSERGDLFILGDLFDYWANNKKVRQDNHLVLTALNELTRSGLRVKFIMGNRDLLLGARALSRYGIVFGGECERIVLQGRHLFLTHGHLFCTNDLEFQRYRRSKWPFYRILDAFLPGRIENALARRFIVKSKKVIAGQEPWRLQFSEDAIKDVFAQGLEMVICGHSHEAGVRRYGENRFLIVLPGWTSQQGGYLCLQEGRFALKSYPEGTLLDGGW